MGSNCLNNESNFFKKHSCDDNKVMITGVCHSSLVLFKLFVSVR